MLNSNFIFLSALLLMLLIGRSEVPSEARLPMPIPFIESPLPSMDTPSLYKGPELDSYYHQKEELLNTTRKAKKQNLSIRRQQRVLAKQIEVIKSITDTAISEEEESNAGPTGEVKIIKDTVQVYINKKSNWLKDLFRKR